MKQRETGAETVGDCQKSRRFVCFMVVLTLAMCQYQPITFTDAADKAKGVFHVPTPTR